MSKFGVETRKALAARDISGNHEPTDVEFRTAIGEICRRYVEVMGRWSSYKVHFEPPERKKKDLDAHARISEEAEEIKHELMLTAAGLLGLHPDKDSNFLARVKLPELLKAAGARRDSTGE